MTKIEKDFHLLVSMAISLRAISMEALIHVDNPTKAGLRKVREARDKIESVKVLIEDRLDDMSAHITENETKLMKGTEG